MDAHRPPQVGAYSLMPRFFAARGYALHAEPLRPAHVAAGRDGLTPDGIFENVMERVGVWQMVARDREGGGRVLVVVFIKETSRAASVLAEFMNLFKTAALLAREAGGALAEALVIVPPAVVEKPRHAQAVAALNVATPGTWHCMHPYHIFAVDVPAAPITPRHEVVPAAEAEQLLRLLHVTRQQLPRLLAADAAVVWCGGKPGDFVRVWRLSETACAQMPVLRLVV